MYAKGKNKLLLLLLLLFPPDPCTKLQLPLSAGVLKNIIFTSNINF